MERQRHARTPWPRIVHAYAVNHDGVERTVTHHVRHSPAGFELGYGGSGPAELARCLLIDLYDMHDLADSDVALISGGRLPVSYQEFKRAFIARLDPAQLRHTIKVSDIEDWAGAHARDRSPANDQD
ncbi:MAG: DUF6166 domain-containing protein [Solirubrobacteraceae bacterium]